MSQPVASVHSFSWFAKFGGISKELTPTRQHRAKNNVAFENAIA
jgi:hypothetical protein